MKAVFVCAGNLFAGTINFVGSEENVLCYVPLLLTVLSSFVCECDSECDCVLKSLYECIVTCLAFVTK